MQSYVFLFQAQFAINIHKIETDYYFFILAFMLVEVESRK